MRVEIDVETAATLGAAAWAAVCVIGVNCRDVRAATARRLPGGRPTSAAPLGISTACRARVNAETSA